MVQRGDMHIWFLLVRWRLKTKFNSDKSNQSREKYIKKAWNKWEFPKRLLKYLWIIICFGHNFENKKYKQLHFCEKKWFHRSLIKTENTKCIPGNIPKLRNFIEYNIITELSDLYSLQFLWNFVLHITICTICKIRYSYSLSFVPFHKELRGFKRIGKLYSGNPGPELCQGAYFPVFLTQFRVPPPKHIE